MPEPIAFFNGQFVEASNLAISVADAGFVMGATVTEQLRTFNGSLFQLEEHLSRLQRSLDTVGIFPEPGTTELASICTQVAHHNHGLLSAGDDLGLCIFVTPGPYPTFSSDNARGPTVCVHTYPLPFRQWVDMYDNGLSLVTTPFQQIAPVNWPLALKCRSRMHYYLADRAAREIDPQARALLLDQNQIVSETSTANVLIFSENVGLTSPRRESILPGISLQYLAKLAVELEIPFRHADLTVSHLIAAHEVLLTSTPWCLMPVLQVNGQPIGDGVPGPICQRLMTSWSERCGVDIRAQARRFCGRA